MHACVPMQVDRMQLVLQAAIDEHRLGFPDTLFLYNAEDLPPCLRRGLNKVGCTGGALSVFCKSTACVL